MITVRIGEDHGEYMAESDGHADYNPGNDIVCSAVTALMFTLMGAVDNLGGGGKKHMSLEKGRIKVHCRPKKEDEEAVKTVFQTVEIGLLQIAEKYPEHVQIIS